MCDLTPLRRTRLDPGGIEILLSQQFVTKVSLLRTGFSEPRQGRKRVAHGVSRGIEEQLWVIVAPEERQRPPPDVCRPIRGCES